MRDPKVYRLVLGLILLSSLFLFQGSKDHGGCTQCEDEYLGGSLTVINDCQGYFLCVYIIPSRSVLLAPPGIDELGGSSRVFYLDQGVYQVVGKIQGQNKIAGVRMIEIKLGSNKITTFTNQGK